MTATRHAGLSSEQRDGYIRRVGHDSRSLARVARSMYLFLTAGAIPKSPGQLMRFLLLFLPSNQLSDVWGYKERFETSLRESTLGKDQWLGISHGVSLDDGTAAFARRDTLAC